MIRPERYDKFGVENVQVEAFSWARSIKLKFVRELDLFVKFEIQAQVKSSVIAGCRKLGPIAYLLFLRAQHPACVLR